jgi:hypothetical protein
MQPSTLNINSGLIRIIRYAEKAKPFGLRSINSSVAAGTCARKARAQCLEERYQATVPGTTKEYGQWCKFGDIIPSVKTKFLNEHLQIRIRINDSTRQEAVKSARFQPGHRSFGTKTFLKQTVPLAYLR